MAEKDEFVNQAYIEVIESAPNTLTFKKLETGISIHEKIGWVISRFDYNLSISGTNWGAEGDSVAYGLSTSDAITTLSLGQSAILDYNSLTRLDIGTPATGILSRLPHVKDFSNLPGKGILVPPNPLFLFVMGTALTSAVTVTTRLFYTVRVLKLEDFWELVELRRMIGT